MPPALRLRRPDCFVSTTGPGCMRHPDVELLPVRTERASLNYPRSLSSLFQSSRLRPEIRAFYSNRQICDQARNIKTRIPVWQREDYYKAKKEIELHGFQSKRLSQDFRPGRNRIRLWLRI